MCLIKTTDVIRGTGQTFTTSPASQMAFKDPPLAPPIDQVTNAHDEQSLSQSPKEDTHGSTKKFIFMRYIQVVINTANGAII